MLVRVYVYVKCTHTAKNASAVMHEWEIEYYIDTDIHIRQHLPCCGLVNGLFPILSQEPFTPKMPRESYLSA